MPKKPKKNSITLARKKSPKIARLGKNDKPKKSANRAEKNPRRPSESELEKKITVTNRQGKESPHLINLKNPNQNLLADNFGLEKPAAAPRTSRLSLSQPLKISRPRPKKTKKIGVDFIARNKKLLGQLSLISLFGLIFRPLKKLTAEKPILPSTTPTGELPANIEDIFAKPNYFEFFRLYIPRDWYKKVAIFALIATILVLPLQAFTYYQGLDESRDQILLLTDEAIENLRLGQQAVTAFDLDTANLQFNQAKDNFALAQREINALNFITEEIIKLLPGQDQSIAAGLALLRAGEMIAAAGQVLVNGGQQLLAAKDLNDYYQSLSSFKADLNSAIDQFSQAKKEIETVKPGDLPPEHRETFTKVINSLPTVEKGLSDLYLINSALLKILGDTQWQRYLLIFLNNNELRGGGGFMGSFGIIDIDRGQIKNLEIPGGGTYDLQGQLTTKVISPEPLHLINSRWEFQDANWWPDFPTTAKKIQWFYRNANGPSVDGVVAITSTLMERLLEIFGPIQMPDYGREITSENFVAETQKIVELEYDKEKNRPKQFIADLAPKLLTKIFNPSEEQAKKLLAVLQQALNEKQLLVYFNDNQIEAVIDDFGWSGRLKQTDGDYLAVVQTNIAGGKTDGVIKETIAHQAEIQEDGSIINTVKLTRRHTGIPGENIFTGVQNNSYVRFYVPLGSILIEASGFKKPAEELFEPPKPDYQVDADLIAVETNRLKDEKTGTDIYQENGKTVFGNWLQLKAGEIGEAVIKYRLPFSLSLEGQNTFYYSLLAQKQAGSLGSELKSYLKLNSRLKPLAKFPADLPSDENGVGFNAALSTDQFYGVALISD